MAEITCGHCGATHGSVAEVRACATTTPAQPFVHPAEPDRAPVPRPPSPGPSASPPRFRPGPPARRGPVALGRSLVVPEGVEVPAGWEDVDRFDIDEITALEPGSLLDELQRRWSHREPYVVVLGTSLTEAPATVLRREPWLLDPGLELPRERLHHLVWANSLLAAPDGATTFPAAARAIDLGARSHPSDIADVELPDGTEALVDGGPLDLALAGAMPTPVVHTIGLAAGAWRLLGTTDPTAELAPDQLAAVAHPGGPARIVAPAGSGKTRVLTERARHLLVDAGLPTGALTLVAFNKRAQLEMEQRTTDLEGLRVRTLNALALSVVNGTDGFTRPAESTGRVQTIDEREVRRLLRRLVEVPRRTNTDPLATWIEALSSARLGLRDPAAVVEDLGPDVDDLEQVLEQYRMMLRRQNLVDFDEQILRAIEVLLADPAAREHAQQSCQVLLVDEFQDLTPAHMLFIRLLAGPRADVFGVGDDDQTIYGFTGATPEWLVHYERWFPHACSHALEVNYRCAPAVVEAVGRLLPHNRNRVDKTIRTPNGRPHRPDELKVVTAAEPLRALTDRVTELLASGAAPTDIVILGRVNVALAAPQVALEDAGYPVVHAVTPDLLARTGVRALLAWLRLGVDPGALQPSDVAEAVRRPSRGLSQRVREWMGEHRSVRELRRLGQRLGGRDQNRIDDFLDDVERLADLARDGATAAELFEFVGDDLGVSGALGKLDGARRSVDRSTHLDDLDALVQLGGVQPDPERFGGWLHEGLNRPGASSDTGITLSTVHRVKGLEWPHVIVVGANDGTFPHRLADLEEERRVFHVAVTRSSVTTTVIADAGRPSPFLAELTGEAGPPRFDLGEAPESRPSSRDRRPRGSDPKVTLDSTLGDALRGWRLDTARAAGVPAFVVFSDATLAEIVESRPSSTRELGRVKGVGPKKLEQYGDAILELVAGSAE
jgi:DNA helicase-2/ATP-dependent DNA helicase PcrA